MIKLLFNEDSDATVVGKIVLNGTFFSAEVHDPTFGYSGSDVIEELGAYHSYVFCRKPNSKVKSFRTIHRSDYKFLYHESHRNGHPHGLHRYDSALHGSGCSSNRYGHH